jgi:hypothetical protein
MRVDRDCRTNLQLAGLTKPANAYFGYLVDYFGRRRDAMFLLYPLPGRPLLIAADAMDASA